MCKYVYFSMSKVVTFHPKKMSFHLKNDIALKNIVKIHIVID